ncbi:hypothetical protein ANN_06098, partial [Periplaneta americana]
SRLKSETMKQLLYLLGLTLCLLNGALSNHTIPKDFKFGISSSAYQIEGAWNESGKGMSIWDKYTHETPYIADGLNGDVAADSYHHYKDDIVALEQLGVNFYRFSISWARIMPTGRAHKVNMAGINYYHNVIDGLLSRTQPIEPMVAMHHWDLPQALQDLGGWANPVMAEYFEEYARMLYSEYGSKVKYWVTIVDPHSLAYGYSEPGPFAPGVNSSLGYYLAARTLLMAHSKAFHVYNDEFRSKQNGKVGISLNAEWYEPESNSTSDQQAAELGMQFVLGLFANPIFSKQGDYPNVVKEQVNKISAAEGYPRSRLRNLSQENIASLRGASDFLGLNYYTSRLAKAPKPTNDLKNAPDMNVIFDEMPEYPVSGTPLFEVVPWGFRKLLNWIKNSYNNTPVIITENGFADFGGNEDTERIKFLVSHMSEMFKAINDDGCNIIAYTFWSLLDGFEWQQGYTVKMGMYSVNNTNVNQTRVPKSSAYVYADIIKKRELPKDYLQMTGEIIGNTTKTANVTASNNGTKSSAARHTGMFLTYTGTLLCVWLATVAYTSRVFSS